MQNLQVQTITRCLIRQTDPDWKLDDIYHPGRAVFVYAFSGACDYSIPDRTFKILQGEALLLPPGIIHSVRSDRREPWKLFSCVFEIEKRSDQIPIVIGPSPVSLRAGTILSELNGAWISKRFGYEMRCRGLLLQALAEFMERNSLENLNKGSPHVDKIINALSLIDRNLNKKMSVADLAAACHLSVSRFRTLFTRIVGLSPVQYRNRARMQHAKDLLLSGEFNVSEAAETLGYENVFYFSRLFKKTVGTPPEQFKR